MRVYLTGGSGFVGSALTAELENANHEVVSARVARVDVTDREGLTRSLLETRPDAIAHLAAVAYAPDASADPATALTVNVGGTLNVLEAALEYSRLTERPHPPALLVAGSSEVYGAPRPEQLPLVESAPPAPRTPYALTKVATEALALAYADRAEWPAVVARAFNHIGPGQRPVFVVPALARRVRALRDGEADAIPAGNLDVRRDFSDVRDVVRAYRLLMEGLADGRLTPGGLVVNVCSGRSSSIREILEQLCGLAGVEQRVHLDPALVRPDDPPEIVGANGRLRELTGWEPRWPLDSTLRSVWEEAASSATGVARPSQGA